MISMPSVALARVVRVDHRADAVLELRNHLAAAVVGGRVGREQDQHVDVEADRVAANLHVALFEDVEQADLHQLVQFGQFVHGEDAAVHPRDQAEVQRLFGRHADAAGQLGRVDLADDVGELRARRQPLGVALRRAATRRSGMSSSGSVRHESLARRRDRLGTDLREPGTPGMSRYGISSSRNRTKSRISRLLACPFSPRNSMSCSAISADVDLGDHGVVVADDAGKQLVTALSARRKLSWISCLTLFETQPLWRKSRRLSGRTVIVAMGLVAR